MKISDIPTNSKMNEKMTPQQRRSREGMRTASQDKAGRESGTMMPARGDFSDKYDRDTQFKKNIGPQGTPDGIEAHKAKRGVKKKRGVKEAPTPPQGDTDEAIVLDYRERIKALQDIQTDTEILRDPDLKRAVMIGRAFLAKWKDAWIADDPDREPLFQRWARESKEIKEDGRPRGAAHIENERFWDLSEDELIYIIKDASEAINANPTARKATQGPGNWSDQVNDAYTVLIQRDKHTAESFKGSLVKHTNEGHDPDVFHGVTGPDDDIWFLGDDGEESAGELTYTANLDHDTGRYIVDPASLDGNIDDENNPGKLTGDMVGDVIHNELEYWLEIAQEHADEHANERDSKYAQGESIEDDSVVSALDTMRTHLHDYEHDPSDRWAKYNQYRNERRQISQRAKDVTEWGDTDPLSKELVKQQGRPGLAKDDEEDDKEDVLKKNSELQARKRRLASLRRTNRRDQQQADEL